MQELVHPEGGGQSHEQAQGPWRALERDGEYQDNAERRRQQARHLEARLGTSPPYRRSRFW
jgi:hypothetical protein